MPDIKNIADGADIIKDHYQDMYMRWLQYSENGYYEK
jgi:hypothetical protein